MKLSKILFWLASLGAVGTMAFRLGEVKARAIESNNLFDFFQEKPTEVISSNIVIKEIRELEELASAEYNMETVVSVKAERLMGDNKLLYIAKGKVKAGLDLSNLSDRNIKIDREARIITVSLPPSKILDQKINVNTSEIYQYDEGWFANKDAGHKLLSEAQQTAEVQMLIAACKSKILETANQKAEVALDRLLTMAGYEVKIIPATTEGSCHFS